MFQRRKLATNSFYIKHALKIIFHQLRIYKQKKNSPFEANFGRKHNAPLSVICTTPKLSNFSYEKIELFFDEDTVSPQAHPSRW